MINRLRKINSLLQEKNLDAILISSVPNIFYLTDFSNFSSEEREAYVLITKDKQYVFTDGRYIDAVKKEVQNFLFHEITAQTPFIKHLTTIVKQTNIKTIGFEETNITYWEYKRLAETKCTLVPVEISTIRSQKEPDEIIKIRAACQLGDETFRYMLSKVEPDVTEKALQTEIELFIKQHGADISFKPIVAFGENAAIPHHQSGNRKLRQGDCVLFDLGAKVNNYCSDMSRTVFFGKPTSEQKKVYQTVLESQKRAIDSLSKDGSSSRSVLAKNVDAISRNYITSQNYPTIPHSLGHGTGIEVHESPHVSPAAKDTLKENMVFSIEPGIYLPNFMGVRIEDLVLLTKTGVEILTLSPKELIVL